MDISYPASYRRNRVRRWRLAAGSAYGVGALLSTFGVFRLIVRPTLSLSTLVVGGTGLGLVLLGFALIVLGRLRHPAPSGEPSPDRRERGSCLCPEL